MISRIAARRCDTCIFGPKSPVRPAAMRVLRAGWKRGGHQVCHRFGTAESSLDDDPDEREIEGEDVYCRGFFDTQVPADVRAFMLALVEAGVAEFVEEPKVNDDFPITRETARAALNAIHEAFGTPVTRCKHLNRAVREYPDIEDAVMADLLADHDRGLCDCTPEERAC